MMEADSVTRKARTLDRRRSHAREWIPFPREWIPFLRFASAGSILLPMATLWCCHYIWVHEAGCIAWLPAISDFGIPALSKSLHQIFTIGTLLTALMLSVVSIGAGLVRKELLRQPGCKEFEVPINRLVASGTYAGLVCASGIGSLGLFPWHDAFVGHAIATCLVFAGGYGWMWTNAVLLRRLAWLDPRTRFVRFELQWGLGATTLAASMIALGKFAHAFQHLTNKFTLGGPARIDPHLHCRNGWGAGLEVAWVCEWLLCIMLTASFATAWADVSILDRYKAEDKHED